MRSLRGAKPWQCAAAGRPGHEQAKTLGDFLVAAIIMVPISLSLLGIIPAVRVFYTQKSAISMNGFIALAGSIVRNSILLVVVAVEEVRKGVDVREAVLLSCKIHTRPISITVMAPMGGASVILADPSLQGMAVSLRFGVLISTRMTWIVIPVGCISSKYILRCIDLARNSGTVSSIASE